eukprot:m.245699 g.245699  ORF g.245699 m.245699 type:complete len:412 (+) comp33838_c2_seq3:390-1625(+)
MSGLQYGGYGVAFILGFVCCFLVLSYSPQSAQQSSVDGKRTVIFSNKAPPTNIANEKFINNINGKQPNGGGAEKTASFPATTIPAAVTLTTAKNCPILEVYPAPPEDVVKSTASRNVSRTAIVLKTMAPFNNLIYERIHEIEKGIEAYPEYDIIIIADTTVHGKGESEENTRCFGPRVSVYYFNENEFLVFAPEIKYLWYDFLWTDNNGKEHKGYQCCGRTLLWQFQHSVVSMWLHQLSPQPYNHVWLLQDDVFAIRSGHYVMVDEIVRIDAEVTADLVGWEFLLCPAQGCPGWGGSSFSTKAFDETIAKMHKATPRVRYQCFSDGLQRLSRDMFVAYDAAIKAHKWRFAEGMVQVIAWEANLSTWSYTVQQGQQGHLKMPPCPRQDQLEVRKKSEQDKTFWWVHGQLYKN